MSNNKRRLFIGLPLDAEGERGVRRVMKILSRKHWHVLWVGEYRWHLTVLFLGDTPKGMVGLIEEAMRVVVEATEEFELAFKGMGAFPSLLLPGVIWLGVRGDLKALHRLRKPLGVMLDEKGVVYDRKPFSPHITLGRVRNDASRKERVEMGKNIGKMRRMEIPQVWQVKRAVLFESELIGRGSRYTELVSVDLKGEIEDG